MLRLALAIPAMVLVARVLEPADFGSFSAALAMLSIAFPAACWAVGHVLVRRLARGSIDLDGARGEATYVIAAGAAACAVVLVLVGPWFVPTVSRPSWLLLTAAELLATNGLAVMGQLNSAVRDFTTVVRLAWLLGVFRLSAALVLALGSSASLSAWVADYSLASMLAVAVALAVQRPLASWRPRRPSLGLRRGGAPFVVSAVSSEIVDDGDKVALVHFGLPVDAGLYSVAYKLAALVGLPSRALLFVTYPEFFEIGHREAGRLRAYAMRQCLVALVPTLVTAVCAVLFAPLLVPILGAAYAPAVPYLRWLAFVPVVRLVAYYGADVLTGLDRQWPRALCQTGGAIATIALLILLVPAHGGAAAVVVSLGVEVLLATAMWILALRATRPGRVEVAT